MEKRTVIDQIEIKPDGTVQVRVVFEIWDGEVCETRAYHRFILSVGTDIEPQIEIVNQHIAAMGKEPVSARDIRRIARIAGHVWTPKVRAAADAAHTARMADAQLQEADEREQLAAGLPDTKQADEKASIERLREAADKLKKQAEKAAAKAAAMKDEDD